MEHRASCKHIYCPYAHPQPLGWGLKVKTFFFTEISHVHIKFKGIEQNTMQSHTFLLCLHMPSTRQLGSKGQSILFSESSHVAYQVKENGAIRPPCKHIFCPYTHTLPLGWSQNIFFLKISHVAYQVRREWSIEHNASTYSQTCLKQAVKG